MHGLTHIAILSASAALLLTACAPYAPDSTHAGICNELNSKVIFSGGTSDIRRAEMQDSQEELTQQNYDRKCS